MCPPPIPTTPQLPHKSRTKESQIQDLEQNTSPMFQNTPQTSHPNFPQIHPQSQPNNNLSTQNNPTIHFEYKVFEPANGTVTTQPNNNRPKRQITQPK